MRRRMRPVRGLRGRCGSSPSNGSMAISRGSWAATRGGDDAAERPERRPARIRADAARRGRDGRSRHRREERPRLRRVRGQIDRRVPQKPARGARCGNARQPSHRRQPARVVRSRDAAPRDGSARRRNRTSRSVEAGERRAQARRVRRVDRPLRRTRRRNWETSRPHARRDHGTGLRLRLARRATRYRDAARVLACHRGRQRPRTARRRHDAGTPRGPARRRVRLQSPNRRSGDDAIAARRHGRGRQRRVRDRNVAGGAHDAEPGSTAK